MTMAATTYTKFDSQFGTAFPRIKAPEHHAIQAPWLWRMIMPPYRKKSPKHQGVSNHEKRYFFFRNGTHSKNVYSKCTHVGGVMLQFVHSGEPREIYVYMRWERTSEKSKKRKPENAAALCCHAPRRK